MLLRLHCLLLRCRLLLLLLLLGWRLLGLLLRSLLLLRCRLLLGLLLLLLRLLLLRHLLRGRSLLHAARAPRHRDLNALSAGQARAVSGAEAGLLRRLPRLQLLRRRLPGEDGAAGVGGDGCRDGASRRPRHE